MRIIDNYTTIKEEIHTIATSAGIEPNNIQIVSVSKTLPPERVQEAIDAGIQLFGENRIQEARVKIPELKGNFTFHLIGHLQSNKAKDAVALFEMIHSIDKTSTAIKVDREAEKINKVQKILVQVNTSEEETKSGVEPDLALQLCKDISQLKNIELLGLMTIGPLTDDSEKIRKSFQLLKKTLEKINSYLGLCLNELSMGMSSDYTIAVEEGATILRIGSAIFGARAY